jgi:TPR repeat protein
VKLVGRYSSASETSSPSGRKTADAGDTVGVVRLGALYSHGTGVKQDFVMAAYYYCQAAEKGSGVGMNNLGYLYTEGFDVSKDRKEAIRWFRKAVRLGNQNAMNALKSFNESTR